MTDDLISRQAAIDAFAIGKELLKSALDQMYVVGNAREKYEFGIGLIESYIADMKELPSAQRWILVTDRLPEASGRYLVTRGLNACGSLWNRIYIANYSDLMGIKSERIWWQGNVGKSDFTRFDDVLAWMPLPRPYKEVRAMSRYIDATERKRVCCNCGRNIRTQKRTRIECNCELDGHYIGYVECMTGWCRRWKKDRKWRENDGEVH